MQVTDIKPVLSLQTRVCIFGRPKLTGTIVDYTLERNYVVAMDDGRWWNEYIPGTSTENNMFVTTITVTPGSIEVLDG